MKILNHLPRTVAELCNHPEVQRIVMQTFATAYSLHLLDCEDQTSVDAEQVWLTFLNALGEGWSQLDDELFERSTYSPVRNS
jgi:hypothetical protein